jgi:hypothetical protein
MKRKDYMKPQMEVIYIKSGQQLLAGSVGVNDLGGDGFTGGGGGDGIGDGDPRSILFDDTELFF